MVARHHICGTSGRAQNRWGGQAKPAVSCEVQPVRRDAMRPECVRLPWSAESSIRFGIT